MPTITEVTPHHTKTSAEGSDSTIRPPYDRADNIGGGEADTLVIHEAEMYAAGLSIERWMRMLDQQELQHAGSLVMRGEADQLI